MSSNSSLAQQARLWCAQLAPTVGLSYDAVVLEGLKLEKMSERRSGDHAETGSVGSSRGSSWRKHRQKERKDREYDQREEMSGTGEGSYQTQRTVSGATGRRQREERDEELERLRRLVSGLELEVRGKHRRRDKNDQ